MNSEEINMNSILHAQTGTMLLAASAGVWDMTYNARNFAGR